MKRKSKNIISILIIFLLILSMGLTVYFSKNNSSNTMSMGGNQPTMSNNGGNMQTPPDKPDGDNSSSSDNSNSNSNSNDSTTPPEKPDGDNSSSSDSNQPPEMPNGSSNNGQSMPTDMSNDTSSNSNIIYYVLFGGESLLLSLVIIYLLLSKANKKNFKECFSDNDKKIIYFLSVIILTFLLTFGLSFCSSKLSSTSTSSTNNPMSDNSNTTGGGSSNSSSATYTAANEITEDSEVSDKEYTSSNSDENALSVSGSISATLSNITVTKSGDSDGGDNTSFYGTNSAIIAKSGATLTLKNIKVTTNATGANGVFCYGGSATTNNSTSDGTTVNISDSTITTTKDNSGGIMTTGGGTTNASNLTINTAGTSSAAIRTDRGGGNVTVTGGTYKTTGQGSPSIYSTAEVTVKDATLEATTSEGVVIEGKNSVSLENVTLTDSNTKLNGQSTTYKNIFLYQSMSGDADSGVSTFTAKNSTITTNNGDTLYVTNTSSKITLTNNKITNNDSDGNFLRIQKDSWGTSGSNGGDVTLILNKQKVKGNIVVDSISTFDMTMKSSSSYTGTINGDNSAKSIKLTLDKTSKIKLTGDSYVSSLDDADSNYSNIDFNGYKLYVNGKAIN